jgi:uncharacterized protein (DUF2141 family)
MKPLMLLIYLAAVLAVAPLPAGFAGDHPGTGELDLIIEGFENSNGSARVALADSKENFSRATPFKGYIFPIVNHRVVETLVLPCGEYAVKVFHDENGNGELDKRILGIPAEAYGFSNDARGPMGPPEYEKAAFQLDSAGKELIIHVQ